MFRTYRKSYRSGLNSLLRQLLCIQLRMCGSGRMNHQRLHIGHIGQQREYLQTIDKFLRFLRSSFYLKSEDRTCSIREITLIDSMIRMIGQRWMINSCYLRMVHQKINNLQSIGYMSFYTQRQSL